MARQVELRYLDYVKTGPYDASCGPLNQRTTNQRLYRVEEGVTLVDITHRFWK